MCTYFPQHFYGNILENYIYHLIKEKCKLYLTYTDGIFLIWTGTLFNKFIDKINESIHRLNLISIIQATA